MHKLKIYLFLALAIFFSQCDESSSTTKKYRIVKNTSGHNLIIDFIGSYSESFVIVKGDSIQIEGLCTIGGENFDNCEIGWSDMSINQSCVITFANDKKINFELIQGRKCTEGERNILASIIDQIQGGQIGSKCGYIERVRKQNGDNFNEKVYEINAQDYLNAE